MSYQNIAKTLDHLVEQEREARKEANKYWAMMEATDKTRLEKFDENDLHAVKNLRDQYQIYYRSRRYFLGKADMARHVRAYLIEQEQSWLAAMVRNER